MHDWVLMIVGAIILALNLLTVGGPLLAWKLRGKRSSPVCIPFAGPIVLTTWVVTTHRPWWAIPLVWCCDLGTIICLVAVPTLFKYWWQTCSFTQTLALRGEAGGQRATLSVHSTGRYHLEKWGNQRPGQRGRWRGGELGSASGADGAYLLKPDRGGSRKLEPAPDGSFQIVAEQLPDPSRNFSIADWRFRRNR